MLGEQYAQAAMTGGPRLPGDHRSTSVRRKSPSGVEAAGEVREETSGCATGDKDIPTRTTTFRSGSEVRIESALHSALLTFLWSYPPLNGGYSKPFPATP